MVVESVRGDVAEGVLDQVAEERHPEQDEEAEEDEGGDQLADGVAFRSSRYFRLARSQ